MDDVLEGLTVGLVCVGQTAAEDLASLDGGGDTEGRLHCFSGCMDGPGGGDGDGDVV